MPELKQQMAEEEKSGGIGENEKMPDGEEDVYGQFEVVVPYEQYLQMIKEEMKTN